MELKELKKEFDAITAKISRALSKEKASLADYGASFAFARLVEKTFDSKDKSSITAICKEKIVEAVKLGGMRAEGKVSTVFNSGGWSFMMHQTRTGVDPKKLQARLTAKCKAPDPLFFVKKYMAPEISYAVDMSLLIQAKKDRVLTDAELKECEYDESWTLKTPTLEE